MPAAAVIPGSVAYIEVVAVKKFVVGISRVRTSAFVRAHGIVCALHFAVFLRVDELL